MELARIGAGTHHLDRAEALATEHGFGRVADVARTLRERGLEAD